MITTLIVLAGICLLSLAFILTIPSFAKTKLFMKFLPEDIREAAGDHPDPPAGKQAVGYLMTAAAAAIYLGALYFLGADGLRRDTASGLCSADICYSCMVINCSIFLSRTSIL